MKHLSSFTSNNIGFPHSQKGIFLQANEAKYAFCHSKNPTGTALVKAQEIIYVIYIIFFLNDGKSFSNTIPILSLNLGKLPYIKSQSRQNIGLYVTIELGIQLFCIDFGLSCQNNLIFWYKVDRYSFKEGRREITFHQRGSKKSEP